MSTDLLFAWMMVFFRGLGIIVVLPTLGSRPLPPAIRISMAVMMASLLYTLVPRVTELPASNAALIVVTVGEVLLGLVLGFVGRLVFAAVEMAGRMISQEIGLMAAPGIDAPAPSSEPVAALMSAFAGVLFFALGGHFGAMRAFVRSFDFSPAGAPAYSPLAAEYLIQGTARVIELGFCIAAPFMAMNFLVNLSFSVLGRAVPKMNVFILSYPLRALVGFLLLGTSGALFARYLAPEFSELPFRMLEIVART